MGRLSPSPTQQPASSAAGLPRCPLITPSATLRKELDRLVNRAKSDEERKAALNSFKDREMFRIDMKHIVEPDTALPDFSAALTQLAEAILDRSLKDCQTKLNKLYGPPRLANKKPCPFTVLGLGKFGGKSSVMPLILRSCSSMEMPPDRRETPHRQQRIL